MNTDQAKFLADFFAGVMENEFQTTCRVLAAVKDETRSYKPDEKSRTAWDLAVHVAMGDVWFLDSIVKGSFAWDAEAAKQAEGQLKSTSDVVEYYKREFPEKLKQLRALPPDALTQDVDFFGMMKQPRAQFLSFANNHGIHHRGQLAAYLRGMGSKVPSIYGGSADEPMSMPAE
jgi:uncharacterized damage-inducible protein DinB